ncbi:hypothetical protein OIU76_023664 [Salix suchowensis]|nr:hypothetical protein OIU76_023664 [Salix suchowensis]
MWIHLGEAEGRWCLLCLYLETRSLTMEITTTSLLLQRPTISLMGIDFNGGPTGRFCNGYTMVDEIAEQLGLPLIPAYSGASGDQVLNGVNYASAAAGILDITGRNFVGRIPFDQQIRNFQNTLDQITNNLGADDVARQVGRSIFFVGMGSNDYLNNYLMPNYPTRNQYNGRQYADLLTQEYSRQLTTLYNLGARKFVIAGLGEMGCIPSILAQSPAGHCSDSVNQLVQPFNENVKAMLSNFNANQLPGAKFIFIDVARMFREILTNSPAYGFSVINRGCCGIGRNRGQITCLPFQTPLYKQRTICVLGCIPPDRSCECFDGEKGLQWGLEHGLSDEHRAACQS